MSSRVPHELERSVGAAHVLRDDRCISYEIDERRLYRGHALAVVRPADVHEVAEIVKLCAAQRVAMAPHGGNTGYCGSATADGSGS